MNERAKKVLEALKTNRDPIYGLSADPNWDLIHENQALFTKLLSAQLGSNVGEMISDQIAKMKQQYHQLQSTINYQNQTIYNLSTTVGLLSDFIMANSYDDDPPMTAMERDDIYGQGALSRKSVFREEDPDPRVPLDRNEE